MVFRVRQERRVEQGLREYQVYRGCSDPEE